MIQNTQLGKILLRASVVDFSLGNTLPYIHNVTAVRPKRGELGSFEASGLAAASIFLKDVWGGKMIWAGLVFNLLFSVPMAPMLYPHLYETGFLV